MKRTLTARVIRLGRRQVRFIESQDEFEANMHSVPTSFREQEPVSPPQSIPEQPRPLVYPRF